MKHTEREYQLEQHIYCLNFTLQQMLLAINTGNEKHLLETMQTAHGYVKHWMDNLLTHYLQHPNWDNERVGAFNPLWQADLAPKDDSQ